ncbi:MAG: hypothetical protein K2Q18_17635, partial [Bdellovibrionales bacterium]|nr:hypothetical protein [Bdellovibrionales bacterium]
MKKMSESPIYDLALIGNGIAAQSFLWNLSNKKKLFEDSKSQNFTLAHIYSEALLPSCSLKSTATVSLNGIDEDVSTLGNDMREAFFLFDNLVKSHGPKGVEEVERVVISTNENDTKKLLRRYKKLDEIKSEKIKGLYPGVSYKSFMITPEVFSNWLSEKSFVRKTDYQFFVKNLEKHDDLYHLILEDGTIVIAKKIIFATGAFSKIFEKFYMTTESESIELKNQIKAGSYLERNIDLKTESFYISIDGHQILYRNNAFEKKLIVGNGMTVGAFEAPDLQTLSQVFLKFKEILSVDIGEISDFKIITGLRHKGPKRLMICEKIDREGTLFRINGLYKNGYTMG